MKLHLAMTASLIGFLSTATLRAEPVHAVFEGRSTIYRWTLDRIDPNLPTDWSSYEFLVLELRASSSQRFELGLLTPNGMITKRIHPLANAWIRASVPLRFYRQPPGDGSDLAATMNQPRNSYWINIEQGGHGPINIVNGIAVIMYDPVVRSTLDIRSVNLAKEDPGDAVLDPKPLIDEFGQYIQADWPGKAKSLDDLKKAWTDEETELRKEGPLPGRCQYGGFLNTKARATGFFHVEQIDGRWWFVCPEGHRFFSSGSNGIGTASGTRSRGREELFTSIPAPVTNAPPGRAGGADTGRGGRGGRGGAGFGGGAQTSFYTANLQRRYGDDWRPKWADLTVRRLDAWGMNTVSGQALTNTQPRKPYVMFIRGWQVGQSIMGMPDVYAEDFARRVDETAAQQLAPVKDDPYLIGYFIGNEPPWPGREGQLVDMLLAGPDSNIKKELQTWLQAGDTPERRKEFVLRAFEKYLTTIVAATKKHDPNHLNLGIRFGGRPPEDVIRLAKIFDVYSHNIYRYAPDPKYLDKLYELTGRPILIGEFHIGAPGRGLAAGLVQARDQKERGVAYRYYVENAAAHPAVIGTHWFQWIDQPSTGRMDGENYNIGMVDVTDRPYAEMVEAMQETHKRLLAVHSGTEPPVSRMPEGSAPVD
ncbi:MAG: hypothetical protein ABSA97_02850 [Verrucomicrobiia bacterium]